jgi:hypothetical protein
LVRSRLAIGRDVYRKQTSVTLVTPGAAPYDMNAAIMLLERHERGIHVA